MLALGAGGVHLAVHLLDEEVHLAARRALGVAAARGTARGESDSRVISSAMSVRSAKKATSCASRCGSTGVPRESSAIRSSRRARYSSTAFGDSCGDLLRSPRPTRLRRAPDRRGGTAPSTLRISSSACSACSSAASSGAEAQPPCPRHAPRAEPPPAGSRSRTAAALRRADALRRSASTRAGTPREGHVHDRHLPRRGGGAPSHGEIDRAARDADPSLSPAAARARRARGEGAPSPRRTCGSPRAARPRSPRSTPRGGARTPCPESGHALAAWSRLLGAFAGEVKRWNCCYTAAVSWVKTLERVAKLLLVLVVAIFLSRRKRALPVRPRSAGCSWCASTHGSARRC